MKLRASFPDPRVHFRSELPSTATFTEYCNFHCPNSMEINSLQVLEGSRRVYKDILGLRDPTPDSRGPIQGLGVIFRRKSWRKTTSFHFIGKGLARKGDHFLAHISPSSELAAWPCRCLPATGARTSRYQRTKEHDDRNVAHIVDIKTSLDTWRHRRTFITVCEPLKPPGLRTPDNFSPISRLDGISDDHDDGRFLSPQDAFGKHLTHPGSSACRLVRLR